MNQTLSILKTESVKYRDSPSFATSLFAILLLQVPLFWLSFGRFLPVGYGWFLHWSELGSSSTVYNDWFYPLPPVSLWIMGDLPSLFSGHIALAEQVVSFVVWVLLVASTLAVTRLLAKPLFAAVGTLIASCLYYASPGNIIAGYFELAMALLLMGSYFLLIGIERIESRQGKQYLILSGIAFALSAGTKQTFAIPVLVVIIGLLVALFANYSRTRRIFAFWFMGLTAVGFVILFWALINKNLLNMLSQVMAGGGKEVSADTTLPRVFNDLFIGAPFWISALIVALISFSNFEQLNPKLQLHGAQTALWLVAIIGILFPSTFALTSDFSNPLAIWIALLLFAVAYLSTFYRDNPQRLLKIVFLICTLWIVGAFFFVSTASTVSLQKAITDLLTGLSVIFIALYPFAIAGKSNVSKNVDLTRRVFVILIVVVAVLFANGLSGGNGIEPAVVAVSIFLALLFEKLVEHESILGWVVVLTLVFAALIGSVFRTKLEPYEWFGIKVEPQAWKIPQQVPLNPYLSHFNLSGVERRYYDKLYTAIESLPKNSSVVYGPQSAGLIELHPKLNPVDLRCPIIWWDVCPEVLAAADVMSIKSNPPDLLVWNIPPVWVTDFHERVFRAGRVSAIREIDNWIKSEIQSGRYEVVITLYPDFGGTKSTDNWMTYVVVLEELTKE